MKWNTDTQRAEPAFPGSPLNLVASHGVRHVKHTLWVPRGACPVSGNPLLGLCTVVYYPGEHAIEVASLRRALHWACTSRASGAPRSAEALAAWLARTVQQALNRGPDTLPELADGYVRLDLLIRPGFQVLTVQQAFG